MKKYLAIILLLFPWICLAQTDTVFYKRGMTIIVKEGEKYKMTSYNTKGNLTEEAYSLSLDSVAYDGYYISYYDNGRKREYGNYIKGNKVGQWKLKYEDTDRIWAVVNYHPDKKDSTEDLMSFYRSGKVKRKEWIVNQKSYGVCFSESDDTLFIPYIPFVRVAEFDGDVNVYLMNTVNYPDYAREHGQEGKAYVQFIILEDGTVEPAKTWGYYKSLNIEAERVVKLMPKWIPCMIDDKPARSYFTLPVHFRLQ